MYIPSYPFAAAIMSVLGLILSSYPYPRSAMVRFPLMKLKKVEVYVIMFSITLLCKAVAKKNLDLGLMVTV